MLRGEGIFMGNNNPPPSDEADHDRHFAPPLPPSNTDYRHARFPEFSTNVNPTPNRVPALAPVRRERGTSSWAATRPRIAVVGVCSAGKSTLVAALKEAGYNARAISQEHSYVAHLWQLTGPDLLIYLDATLHTIRRRRRAKWQQETLDEEHKRLAHAREHCDLYISTDGLAPGDVASRAISFLRTRANNENRPSSQPDEAQQPK